MARKVTFDFTPSVYQQKIFDFITNGSGNGVVEAYAGSGKTTTIVTAMKLIPRDKKCLFIAFNKSIAEELTKRLEGRNNITVRTLHSLGYLMTRRNLGSNIEIDEYKYRNYVKKNIAELTTTVNELDSKKKLNDYIESITSLIDFARFNLVDTDEEINNIADKYDIAVSYDECSVVRKCLKWGSENFSTIDYTDMIWLPNYLSMKPIGMQYDWVFLDESQDTSIASSNLFLKTIKKDGRFIAVGDEYQSIYQFAGASEDAIKFLKNYPNTTTLPLPISYRCPRIVIDLARQFVPLIQPREDAPEGTFRDNCKISEIHDGDMVLSRTKTPLVELYMKLLKKKVSCYIKGLDIGQNLIELINSVDTDELGKDLMEDGIFVRLYDKLFNERNQLMFTRGLDFDDATLSSTILEKYDTMTTLATIAERCRTKEELILKINEIFSENESGVCLSTVHKAKGLEADNVYILCRSTMPSKMAKHAWQIQQENNIIYVAYTRPKQKLGFVSEKEIKPSPASSEPMKVIDDLRFIERRVCEVLGKQPMERLESVELARFKLQNKTKVEFPIINEVVEIPTVTSADKKNEELLSELESLF